MSSTARDESFSMDDLARVPKIDAHVHINSPEPALIEQAAADGFRLVTINVDYADFPPIPEQLAIAQHSHRERPQLLAYLATFSLVNWDDPHWSLQVVEQLRQAFARGAAGVKVWKNIGMEFQDCNGRLVMIDDDRFAPLFACITQHNKILMSHQGEPHNCWLPIASMTVNNDKEYFRSHPQYHMYLHPHLPSHEQHMRARNRMLDANPGLRVIGAHLASLEWSLEQVAAFLDRYPRVVVDMSGRMGQIQVQSNRDLEETRLFFLKYQDRLLYGSDLTQDPNADARLLREEAHERWQMDWRYFNTAQTQRVPELDTPVRGLALPRGVVRKIFSENAQRWFGPAL